MKHYKITNLKVLDNYILEVKFENNVTKLYDFKSNFKFEKFDSLKNYTFFKSVKIDIGGNGIYWNDELDLSDLEIWENSYEI